FIPRRDTNAVLNKLAGGRIFPGIHHSATFHIAEESNQFEVEMRSNNDATFVQVKAHVTDRPPGDSVFCSLDEASRFFREGSLGWSARAKENEFDGMELRCDKWQMGPLAIERVESSFFSNRELFPIGSTKFDSAFLMREIPHKWHAQGRLTLEKETL